MSWRHDELWQTEGETQILLPQNRPAIQPDNQAPLDFRRLDVANRWIANLVLGLASLDGFVFHAGNPTPCLSN